MSRVIIDGKGINVVPGESGVEMHVPMAAPKGVWPNAIEQNRSPDPLQGNFTLEKPGLYYVDSDAPGVTGSLPNHADVPGAVFTIVDVGSGDESWSMQGFSGGFVESNKEDQDIVAVLPAGSTLTVMSMGVYYAVLGYSGSILYQNP